MLKMKMKLLLLLSFLWLVNSENVLSSKSRSLQPRIIGGYNCSVEEYAYLVSISFGAGEVLCCGGSLINTRWVLTAGHCCLYMKPSFLLPKYQVHFGQKKWLEDGVQTTTIEKVVLHKEYNDKSLDNDICLLKLKDEVKTDAKVKISKLATTDQYNDMVANKKCDKSLVLGFGQQILKPRANPSGMHKGYIDHVQCGNVMVRDQSYCTKTLNMDLGDTVFCAGDSKRESPATDVCNGDTGGPLLCDGVQIGIVSATFGCNTEYPGIYTRVDKFMEFIRAETTEFRKQVPAQVPLKTATTESQPTEEKSADSSAETALVHLRVLFIFICIVYLIGV